MTPETWFRLFALLLASPMLMLAVHMTVQRLAPHPSRQISAVRALLASYLPAAVLLWACVLRGRPDAAAIASTSCYAFLVHTCFAIAYFHLYNMSETARRIRILHVIGAAGSLPAEQVTSLYGTADIIASRLHRLVAMGQLRFEGGRYAIDGKLLYAAARIIRLWRRTLRLGEGPAGR
jgi:hypothetical protein